MEPSAFKAISATAFSCYKKTSQRPLARSLVHSERVQTVLVNSVVDTLALSGAQFPHSLTQKV